MRFLEFPFLSLIETFRIYYAYHKKTPPKNEWRLSINLTFFRSIRRWPLWRPLPLVSRTLWSLTLISRPLSTLLWPTVLLRRPRSLRTLLPSSLLRPTILLRWPWPLWTLLLSTLSLLRPILPRPTILLRTPIIISAWLILISATVICTSFLVAPAPVVFL